MSNGWLRRIGRGVALGCLTALSLMAPTGRADALQGIASLSVPLGSCQVNYLLDHRFGSARIELSSASGIPLGFAGGSFFSDANITQAPAATGNITIAELQSCGLSGISGLDQNGANATFATDDYIGFSFVVTVNNIITVHTYALNGASATTTIRHPPPPNTPPVATVPNSGQMFPGRTRALLASGTDADGDPLTYAWTATAPNGADAGSFSNPNIAQPVYTAPALAIGEAPRLVTLTLTVSDGKATDAKSFFYEVVFPPNTPPVATVQNSGHMPAARSMTLTASGTDADNDPLTFTWTATAPNGADAGSFSNPNIAQPVYSSPTLAIGEANRRVTLTLTVSDGKASDSKSFILEVVNSRPTANAGSNRTIGSGTSMTPQAKADDANGDKLTFSWTATTSDGTAEGSFDNPSRLQPVYTAPVLAIDSESRPVTLTLTVSDGTAQTSASATITITPPVNNPPTVSAGGPGRAVSGTTAQVFGSGIDNDPGDQAKLTYSWTATFNDGTPAGSFDNPNIATPFYTAPTLTIGSLPRQVQLTLRVSDGLLEAQSTTSRLVTPPVNNPPTVTAKTNKPTVPANTVIGVSADAKDADGPAGLTYTWTTTAGRIDFPNDQNTYFASPLMEVNAPDLPVTVTVTVSDGIATATSTLDFIVESPKNQLPIVTASAAKPTVQAGETVDLTGLVTDLDDDQFTYLWSAPSGTITNGTQLNAQFTAPNLSVNANDQVVQVELTVTDSKGGSATAQVPITVQSKKNTAPTAAPSFKIEGTTVTLSANASDADKDELTYNWVWIGGNYNPNLASPTSANPQFSNPATTWNEHQLSSTFAVTVTDDDGATDKKSVEIVFQRPPRPDLTVNAGANRTIKSGDSIQLSPNAVQGDGVNRITYLWSTTGGQIANPNIRDAFFVAPIVTQPTDVQIKLVVADSLAATAPGAMPTRRTAESSFTITVTPDEPTVINVVAPSTVTEGQTVTLDASGTIDPDNNVQLLWTQTAGPDVLGTGSVQKSQADPQRDNVLRKGVPGPIATFVAPPVPDGQEQLILGFQVTAFGGVGQTVTQAVTITVTRAGPTADQTQVAVNQFAQTRVNNLIALQPDLSSIVTGGDGTANLTVSSMGGQVDLSTAPDQPFWLRIKGNWSNIAGSKGDYVLGSVGAHIKVSDGLALGVMAQVDHQETVTGLAVAKGTGYLIGPYVVAKLPDQPLTVQGRLLYGKTSNEYSPTGAFVDSFDSTRLLAMLGVSGQIAKDDVIWKPNLQAAYAREQTDAYTDGFGLLIAPGNTAVAQVSAGIDVTFPIDVPAGGMTATLGLSDIWSGSLEGTAAAYEGHRGKVSAGINRAFVSGAQLSLTATYDGLGTNDYESYGLDMLFQHKF